MYACMSRQLSRGGRAQIWVWRWWPAPSPSSARGKEGGSSILLVAEGGGRGGDAGHWSCVVTTFGSAPAPPDVRTLCHARHCPPNHPHKMAPLCDIESHSTFEHRIHVGKWKIKKHHRWKNSLFRSLYHPLDVIYINKLTVSWKISTSWHIFCFTKFVL